MSERTVPDAVVPAPADREAARLLMSVDNVSKSFGASTLALLRGAPGAKRVLTGVTFELWSGDLMILRGANGSGKSTLMKIMSGLVLADDGEIRTLPREPTGVRQSGSMGKAAQIVGYSSGEERSLHWRLTAMQNLEFTGALYGMDRGAAAANGVRLLKALGLEQCAGMPARSMSSGQRQRLLVARALIADPAVILLDEPTGNMDGDAQRLMWELLWAKVRQGGAVMVSTHRNEDDGQAVLVGTLENGRLSLEERPRPMLEDDLPSRRVFSRADPGGPGDLGGGQARVSDSGAAWNASGTAAAGRRARAFLGRDFAVARSYPMGLLSLAILPLFSSIMLFFLARVVGHGTAYLHAYGGNYFAFAVLGEVAFILQLMVLQTFANSLRESQVTGTLESMLVTGLKLPGLLVYSALWNTVLAVLQVIVLIAISVLVFGMKLNGAPAILGVVVVVLMPVSCLGLGFLEGAFTLVAKRGSPFFAVIGLGSQLFGGVLYPLAVLPPVLRAFANLLPIAHGAEALRAAFLTSDPKAFVAQIAALVALAILYGGAGYLAVRRAVVLAKRSGTIGQY